MSKVHATSRACDTDVRVLVLTVFIQPNTPSEGWWTSGPSLTHTWSQLLHIDITPLVDCLHKPTALRNVSTHLVLSYL